MTRPLTDRAIALQYEFEHADREHARKAAAEHPPIVKRWPNTAPRAVQAANALSLKPATAERAVSAPRAKRENQKRKYGLIERLRQTDKIEGLTSQLVDLRRRLDHQTAMRSEVERRNDLHRRRTAELETENKALHEEVAGLKARLRMHEMARAADQAVAAIKAGG